MEATKGTTKKRKVNKVETEEEKEQKAKRRAQIAKAARKHRQRQKEELLMLRKKVATLEKEVNDIQSELPEEQASETGWQNEAKQHAEIRARVDRENEFLRCTLLEQIKFTDQLQQGLARQPILSNLTTVHKYLEAPLPPPEIVSNGPTIVNLEKKRQMLIRYGKEGIAGAKMATHSAEELLNQAQPPLDQNVELKVQYHGHEVDVNFRTIIKGIDAADFVHTAFMAAQDEDFSNQFSFLSASFTVQALDNDTALVKQVFRLDSGVNAPNLVVLRKQTIGTTSWVIFRSIDVESDSRTSTTSALQKEFVCLRITQLNPSEDGTKHVEVVFRAQAALATGMDSEQHVKDITENGVIQWVKAVEDRTRKLNYKLF